MVVFIVDNKVADNVKDLGVNVNNNLHFYAHKYNGQKTRIYHIVYRAGDARLGISGDRLTHAIAQKNDVKPMMVMTIVAH